MHVYTLCMECCLYVENKNIVTVRNSDVISVKFNEKKIYVVSSVFTGIK